MQRLRQSPTEDGFVQNPYRLYAQVLTGAPVRFWEDYGMAAVFDAAQVQSLLRDRRLGRARPAEDPAATPDHLVAFQALEAVSMLDLEPPAHTRLRDLVLRAFTSQRIGSLAPDIQRICDDLISRFPAGPFDLLPAYCQQLPVRIIARLIGVPEAMSVQLLCWSNAMVAMYQAGRTRATEDAANTAAAEFTRFLAAYIEKNAARPATTC